MQIVLPRGVDSKKKKRTMQSYIERVVDLLDPDANHIYNLSAEAARELLLHNPVEAARQIQGSFALIARNTGDSEGITYISRHAASKHHWALE